MSSAIPPPPPLPPGHDPNPSSSTPKSTRKNQHNAGYPGSYNPNQGYYPYYQSPNQTPHTPSHKKEAHIPPPPPSMDLYGQGGDKGQLVQAPSMTDQSQPQSAYYSQAGYPSGAYTNEYGNVSYPESYAYYGYNSVYNPQYYTQWNAANVANMTPAQQQAYYQQQQQYYYNNAAYYQQQAQAQAQAQVGQNSSQPHLTASYVPPEGVNEETDQTTHNETEKRRKKRERREKKHRDRHERERERHSHSQHRREKERERSERHHKDRDGERDRDRERERRRREKEKEKERKRRKHKQYKHGNASASGSGSDDVEDVVYEPTAEEKSQARFQSRATVESRFDSRSNNYKRRPVSGVPLALQKKMESGSENVSSHLRLITSKDTYKASKTTKFLTKALKQEVLFEGLGDTMINDIVKVMYKVQCKPEDTIIKQGEYGDAYFVVESGKFHVIHQESPQAPQKVVGECVGGDAFGEGSLLYSIPRAATLQAIEMSIVWALDATKFIEIRQTISKDKNEKTAKTVRFLKKIELFKNYDTHDLTQVAQAANEKVFKKGEIMVKQGDPASEFFVIKRGRADVKIKDNNTGETKVVKTLEGTDWFGDRGIFLNTARAATIVATSTTKCYVIQAPDFKNLLEVPLQHRLVKQMKVYEQENLQKNIRTRFANKVGTRLEGLENIGILGVGSFGRVSLVKDPADGKTYSLKKVRKNKVVETGQEEHVRNERAVLGALDSDFCCKLFATYQDKLNIYFLMEAVLGGELFTVLRWNKRFSEKTARFYTACVVLAFEHLHGKNLIYRDLKPENLLIASNGYCKLVDFGFAKVRNNSCTLCGTPEYLAPEVIQNYPQGFAVDWWELGVFIYEMVVGHAPFQDDPHKKMYEKILTEDPTFPSTLKFTERVVDVVNKLLAKDVYKRLGAGVNGAVQVKKHPWFTGLNWDSMYKQEIKPPYTPRIQDNTDVSNFETYPEEVIDEDLIDDPEGTVYKWCEDF